MEKRILKLLNKYGKLYLGAMSSGIGPIHVQLEHGFVYVISPRGVVEGFYPQEIRKKSRLGKFIQKQTEDM